MTWPERGGNTVVQDRDLLLEEFHAAGLWLPQELIGLKQHDLETSPPFYDQLFLPKTVGEVRSGREGLDSNVVMSPVGWVMRTFIEARAVVQSRTRQVWRNVDEHEAEQLIDQPNEFYDADALWQSTVVSYLLDGNGYWWKIRNVIGDVVQLWYLPHFLVQPKWPDRGNVFMDHYEYSPGGGPPIRIPVRDIVHFRFGLDPRNTRLGLSPIRPILREVFTDDEAALFSAAILKNMGVPGVVVSPASADVRPSKEDVEATKEYFRTAFTGRYRGEPLVIGAPTNVSQFGFDPNKLMLGNLRDIAEERVCSAIGLPAAVVGFGSGMQATKVGATMREMVRLAWVQCLTPIQKSMAKQLTRQLLPDFVAQTRRFRIRFDVSDVSAFQEEENQRAERAARLVQAGILRIDRAQEMVGLEVDETQKVYLRPANGMPVDEEGKPIGQKPEAPEEELDEDEDIPQTILDRMGGNGKQTDEDEE